jgi:hypothetical protein
MDNPQHSSCSTESNGARVSLDRAGRLHQDARIGHCYRVLQGLCNTLIPKDLRAEHQISKNVTTCLVCLTYRHVRDKLLRDSSGLGFGGLADFPRANPAQSSLWIAFVLTVIRPEQCSALTKALRKTNDMGVIWCRQRVGDFASARYPRPQKSRPGAPGSFDLIKERLEINHFEPSLIGLVCRTRGGDVTPWRPPMWR